MPSPHDIDWGLALRRLRDSTVNPSTGKPWTQAQVAEASGFEPYVIYKLETSKYQPTLDRIYPILRAMGRRLDDLEAKALPEESELDDQLERRVREILSDILSESASGFVISGED